jgi:PPK2 family polyphosphate:nucleotide phosphotransferase
MSKKPPAAKRSAKVPDDLQTHVEPFRVSSGSDFHLNGRSTDAKGGLGKDEGRKIVEANQKRLRHLQERLYAENKWSVLIILQGMDASGKDSAIEHVMHGVNPQGCEVHSFKTPSSKELNHDFLWRSSVALPERGNIGIFNRSYYEELLVVRVHQDILAKQRLPPRLVTRNIWRERFEDVTAYERYLSRNGTLILKFFLHESKMEQRQRFLDRLADPAKFWKFSLGDLAERALWDKYQAAYQDVIRHTATSFAPWHVVPADHKWFARVVISSAIVSAMEKLDLQFPKIDKSLIDDFASARLALEQESPAVERATTSKKPIAKAANASTS